MAYNTEIHCFHKDRIFYFKEPKNDAHKVEKDKKISLTIYMTSKRVVIFDFLIAGILLQVF